MVGGVPTRSASMARSTPYGVALVVLGACLFIANAGVSRVALRHGVDPSTLTTIRVTFTFGCLLLAAVLFRRRALRSPRGRQLVLVVAHGVVGVAALQWTYFVALDRLPVGLALLLEYQAPVIVALWALLVQRKAVGRLVWLGLGLAVVGLACAAEVWHGARFDSLGIAAGLAAAVCFACYFLIGEAGVDALDPLQLILWSFGTATIAINVFSPLTGFDAGLLDDRVHLLGRLDGLSAPLWLVLCWVVVLGTVVPFFAELFALSFVEATTVTMVAMLEPIGVSALGWWWFHESLSAIAVVGCLAVVAGILVAQAARPTPAAVEPPVL
jgi:drug/metabolite transporter (DMT)-like permease